MAHMADTPNAVDVAAASLKDAVTALEAEETRLATELATVKGQRMAAAKALEALSGEKPKRRRGRPRNADRVAEPVAA